MLIRKCAIAKSIKTPLRIIKSKYSNPKNFTFMSLNRDSEKMRPIEASFLLCTLQAELVTR